MTHILTAGSLFSGVGMMDYAFAQAGFDIRFQVEIDPYCQKVLRKHAPTYWPHAALYSDVRDAQGERLGYVDVLFGGSPCQDISQAGTRAGIQAGTRSGLWFEFARLIGEIRPRAVLVENVAAITRRDGIKVITDLTRLGYDARWGVISASEMGTPHIRERWWCVAFNVGDSHGQRYGRPSTAERFCEDKKRDDSPRKPEGRHELYALVGNGQVGHTHSQHCQECNAASLASESGFACEGIDQSGTSPRWYEDKPRLDRSPDGPAIRMDRRHGRIVDHKWPAPPGPNQYADEVPRMAPGKANTAQRLKALGNGAVPQIVYPIALYLKGMLKGTAHG